MTEVDIVDFRECVERVPRRDADCATGTSCTSMSGKVYKCKIKAKTSTRQRTYVDVPVGI